MARTKNRKTTTPADTVRADFDNVAALLAFANDGKLTNEGNRDNYNRTIEKSGSAEWYGLPGYTNAREIEALVNAGWTDGAKKAQRNADSVHVAPARSTKRRRVRGDYGDALDVDRLYSGQLDTAWLRTARASAVQPPRIRIVTNMTTPGGADAETLFWRGAATIALASRLIAAGYTVQLVTAFCGTYRPGPRFAITAVSKDFRAPLDPSTLAASTALAGFFRAFGFLALIKTAPNPLDYGLGIPAAVTEADLPPIPNTRTFIVNDGDCASHAAASQWIANTIAQIEQPAAIAA